jgi:hypothetical protein
MNLFPTTFQEILRLLVQPLHIAAIFPAAVWALINVYVVIPVVSRDFPRSQWSVSTSLIAIIVFSYLLYVLNGPLVQFAEGYAFEWTTIGKFKKRRWLKRYDDLIDEVYQCERQLSELKSLRIQFVVAQLLLKLTHTGSDPRIGQLLDKIKASPVSLRFLDEIEYDPRIDQALTEIQADARLRHLQNKIDEWTSYQRSLEQQKQFYYPASRSEIIPTRLGNIMAAFEGYAHNRYGMDAIYLWPRLTPILQAEGYAAFVEQEKAAFDFLLNLGYISLLIGLELVFVFLLTLQYIPAVVTLLCAPIIAYGFYWVSHNAAIHWGGRMKSAFDLYREHLREMLQVRKPVSFDDERMLWQKLSNFYRTADSRFEEFSYYRHSLPIVIGESTGLEVSKVTVEERRDNMRLALILRNTRDEKAIGQAQVVDFVETDYQPCDITVSDPTIKLTHRRLDEWANAYQWTLGPIAGNSTIIVTYSLCRLETARAALGERSVG